MSQKSRDRVNSLCVRSHEKNSGDAVRRLGIIIQSIFCAQSGASIRLTIWKWSGESRYPRAFPPVLENFRRTFSPDPTDCPWVSEDGPLYAYVQTSNDVTSFIWRKHEELKDPTTRRQWELPKNKKTKQNKKRGLMGKTITLHVNQTL